MIGELFFFVSHPLIGPEPNGRAGAKKKKKKKHAAVAKKEKKERLTWVSNSVPYDPQSCALPLDHSG